MSIQYTYEISKTDLDARVMEVIYTAEGRQTMHIGARLPFVGESLEAVIEMYSPVAYWLEQEAQVELPTVGAKGTIVPVVPGPAPVVTPSSITSLEFIDRFTDAEQLAIVTATLQNPQVKLWYDKLLAAQEVVFADPRLAEGLNGLVDAGLLTESRAAEILPEGKTSGVTVL